MTMAISKAVEARRARRSSAPPPATPRASAAAYAAARRHDLRRARARRARSRSASSAQALVHGAQLLQVDGNFDDCLDAGPQARRATTRWRWSTRSTRTASRARRPPRSRSSTRSATPPTSTACRSATPATSPPTGRATASTPPTASPTRRPRMWGFQAAGAAPIVRGAAGRAPGDHRHRDPDRQPGVVDAGRGRPRRVRRPASTRSPTARSSPPTGCWPAARASSSSRLGAPRVAGLLQVAAAGRSTPGQRVVCTVTGHGLKDPDWAHRRRARRRSTVPVDAAAAAAALGLRRSA